MYIYVILYLIIFERDIFMKKKVLLILALLWFLISFLIIQVTYAKYLSSINSNTSVGISAWRIKLNTQDIINNSNFSQNLALTFPGDSYYIQNVVVPGAMRIF